MDYEVDNFDMSSRGFLQGKPIPSSYGGEVSVFESSAASAPHIWVEITSPTSLNDYAINKENYEGDWDVASAHITLENARVLRDQLDFLLENHYQLYNTYIHHSPMRHYTEIFLYRKTQYGVEIVTHNGEVHVIDEGTVPPDEYYFARIPYGAVESIRDALLERYPVKDDKDLREALAIERARIDKVLFPE